MSINTIESIGRRDALNLIHALLKKELDTEYVPLSDSLGRVTARDIVSKVNLPDTPSSRWDGIGLNYERYAACGGKVENWQNDIDYKFTNTGIGIFNSQFDTVVKIEDTVFEADGLKAIKQAEKVVKGQNVIPVGERMGTGEVLVVRDTLIRPSHLNLMASGGNFCIPVYKIPVVALVPSGDELVPCCSTPKAGQTIESNTFSMKAKVELWGGRALIYPIVRDDAVALKRQLVEAAKAADLIVICGGSGRGKFDLLQKSIEEIGTLHFSSVDHGPGKRTCFAQVNGVPVLGLVGPPGGEEMTFDFYAVPAIRALLRQRHQETVVSAILDSAADSHSRVHFYFTVKLYRGDDGELHCMPLPHATIDKNIAEHNGYLYIPKNAEGYKIGERVNVEIRIGYENI